MVKHFIPSLLLLTICGAFVVTAQIRNGELNGFRAALAASQPRLLFWNRRPDNPQQPIVIVQPNQDSNRDRRPPWADYPYFPPYRFPPNQIPGLSDLYGGTGGSIIIVNPNNAQNFSFPPGVGAAAGGAGGGAGVVPGPGGGRSGSFRRESIPLIDILQGLSAQENDSEANEWDGAAPLAAATTAAQEPLGKYGAGEEQYDKEPNEDEFALLERQAARGLSPKQLFSYLVQDKKRRRFQEAVAGIYLRNYNQNQK
ncbi:uncharacterized protein LOC6576690 [Drosophila mojavensis]|uniref:uncharacterized protein LOC6576690 n=1 Tax=Drosophila mojavensis TaxID=7230 RepID=UPI00017C8BC4|nr:uncharacterized protein LOC6576690 [Drosophila mojavensis]